MCLFQKYIVVAFLALAGSCFAEGEGVRHRVIEKLRGSYSLVKQNVFSTGFKNILSSPFNKANLKIVPGGIEPAVGWRDRFKDSMSSVANRMTGHGRRVAPAVLPVKISQSAPQAEAISGLVKQGQESTWRAYLSSRCENFFSPGVVEEKKHVRDLRGMRYVRLSPGATQGAALGVAIGAAQGSAQGVVLGAVFGAAFGAGQSAFNRGVDALKRIFWWKGVVGGISSRFTSLGERLNAGHAVGQDAALVKQVLTLKRFKDSVFSGFDKVRKRVSSFRPAQAPLYVKSASKLAAGQWDIPRFKRISKIPVLKKAGLVGGIGSAGLVLYQEREAIKDMGAALKDYVEASADNFKESMPTSGWVTRCLNRSADREDSIFDRKNAFFEQVAPGEIVSKNQSSSSDQSSPGVVSDHVNDLLTSTTISELTGSEIDHSTDLSNSPIAFELNSSDHGFSPVLSGGNPVQQVNLLALARNGKIFKVGLSGLAICGLAYAGMKLYQKYSESSVKNDLNNDKNGKQKQVDSQ